MYCYFSESSDPAYNLALEEYLLKKKQEEYFLMYINRPSIIIGKHQLSYAEIHLQKMKEMAIPLYRRISGGGTVFHDWGNVNFSFIRNMDDGRQIDFGMHMDPIVKLLNGHGLPVVSDRRHNLTLHGLKISGNAEHVYKKRVLHHGTLLFETSPESIKSILSQNYENYSGRYSKSVTSGTTFISKYTSRFCSTGDFARAVFGEMAHTLKAKEMCCIQDSDNTEINSIIQSKFVNENWNYLYIGDYSLNRFFIYNHFKSVLVLSVKDGIIEHFSFKNTTQLPDDLNMLMASLPGTAHLSGSIASIISKISGTESGKNLAYQMF